MVDRKAMEKVDRSQTKEKAGVILAKMNAILRKMPINEAVKKERFGPLQDRLSLLGWLGLCDESTIYNRDGCWTQLKLVDPDSEKGREIP